MVRDILYFFEHNAAALVLVALMLLALAGLMLWSAPSLLRWARRRELRKSDLYKSYAGLLKESEIKARLDAREHEIRQRLPNASGPEKDQLQRDLARVRRERRGIVAAHRRALERVQALEAAIERLSDVIGEEAQDALLASFRAGNWAEVERQLSEIALNDHLTPHGQSQVRGAAEAARWVAGRRSGTPKTPAPVGPASALALWPYRFEGEAMPVLEQRYNTAMEDFGPEDARTLSAAWDLMAAQLKQGETGAAMLTILNFDGGETRSFGSSPDARPWDGDYARARLSLSAGGCDSARVALTQLAHQEGLTDPEGAPQRPAATRAEGKLLCDLGILQGECGAVAPAKASFRAGFGALWAQREPEDPWLEHYGAAYRGLLGWLDGSDPDPDSDPDLVEYLAAT